MKLTMVLLAAFGLNAFAAELKVLKNYDKVTKSYTGVEVSTTDKPLVLTAILSEKDGLCHKGVAVEVERLVESMAVLANATAADDLVYGKPVVTLAGPGVLALTVPYKTTWEKGEWSWTKIPTCVR